MRTVHVEQVWVTHWPSWGKWPNTEDRDYSSVLALRSTWSICRGEDVVEITSRFSPAYLPYILAGESRAVPPAWPYIDNTKLPSRRVLDVQRDELRRLAAECHICYWDHAWQCFPPVAADVLPRFGLSILMHADDCPGSSEIKTFPVARWFNVLIHAMNIFDFNTGTLVADEYGKRGLADCRWIPNGMTEGTPNWIAESRHTVEAQLFRLRAGSLPLDLVWAGDRCGRARRGVLLAGAETALGRAGIPCRLHGQGMRDGILMPAPSAVPAGRTCAPVYVQAKMGLNVPLSSIWNCRVADLMFLGVPMVAWDPWGELAAKGFLPGEHWIPFDGTPDGLVRTVLDWRGRGDDLARVARAAHDRVGPFTQGGTGSTNAYNDVILERFIEGVR